MIQQHWHTHMARRHNLVCVGIHDRREQQMVAAGYVSFYDLETGQSFFEYQ